MLKDAATSVLSRAGTSLRMKGPAVSLMLYFLLVHKIVPTINLKFITTQLKNGP